MMDAQTQPMTPQEIAKELAAFYRRNPTKWIRNRVGSKTHGCCVMGGALEIANENGGTVGRFSAKFALFLRDTGRIQQTSCGVTTFNDQVAKDVNAIVDALEEFAACAPSA